MSRVGKSPISVPKGVTVKVDGKNVSVSGPLGSLNRTIGSGVAVEQADGVLRVERTSKDKQSKSNFGTTRAVINNMVKGVTEGWKRSLELVGVGFTAKINGGSLVLTVGFSHEVAMEIPRTVKCQVTKNNIDLESPDIDVVSNWAAKIRDVQPPEPYLGKGIRYVGEVVRRKAGKTGKK